MPTPGLSSTVTYTRRGRQFVMHMTGEAQFTTDLAQHLYEFTEQQALIDSLSSPADLMRQAQRQCVRSRVHGLASCLRAVVLYSHSIHIWGAISFVTRVVDPCPFHG